MNTVLGDYSNGVHVCGKLLLLFLDEPVTIFGVYPLREDMHTIMTRMVTTILSYYM